MKLIIMIITLSLVCSQAHAQECPCIKGTLSLEKDKVTLENYKTLRINFTLKNCSHNVISIDTLNGLDYEHNEPIFFFRIDKCDTYSCAPYRISPVIDVGIVEHINGQMNLKSKKSFSYNFNLFPIYNIRERGTYRIIGFYTMYMMNNPGKYVVKTNSVTLEIL